MTIEQVVVEAIDYAFTLAIRIVGLDRARQLTAERIEILAARAAADAEVTARLGQVPPP